MHTFFLWTYVTTPLSLFLGTGAVSPITKAECFPYTPLLILIKNSLVFSVAWYPIQLEKNGIISHLLSSCVWAGTAVKLNFKEHPMRTLKVDLYPFQSLFLFPQSLKRSSGVSLIVYVNTARNRNTSEYLGGGLKYGYRCQKMWDNVVPVTSEDFCMH